MLHFYTECPRLLNESLQTLYHDKVEAVTFILSLMKYISRKYFICLYSNLNYKFYDDIRVLFTGS